MKKTLSLFMAIMAVSASQAATVLQPDFNYNGYWVYVWNGGDNGNWSENNWGVLKNSSQSSLQSGDGYKPINQDPGFIGYDFSVEGGKQTFTSNQTAITVTAGSDLKSCVSGIYLGDYVTLNATECGDYGAFSMHLGTNTQVNFNFDMGVADGTVFDFGQMTGNSLVTIGTAWLGDKTTILKGSYTLSGLTSSIDMLHIGFGDGSIANFDGSQLQVTDSDGNTLTYAQDASNLKEGEFGLQYNDGNVQLVAMAVPEPATAALGLIGLGTLLMRRRRS